jgi:glutaredoxin
MGAKPTDSAHRNITSGTPMAIIRWLIGSLLLLLNWIFAPRPVQRDIETQDSINQQTRGLTLYHYKACPFCLKVRRAMQRQSLAIETRDVKRSEVAKSELMAGGGLLKVPCLRIDEGKGRVSWMYESRHIIGYLEGRFAADLLNTSAEIN